MKKKLLMLVLALGVLAMAAGCGEKEKDKEDGKVSETTEAADSGETVSTDSSGHVVAVEVDDIEKYVTLGEYKNVEVEVEKQEITDETLDEYIKQQLIYKPEEITEDREIQENDTVNIDFTGYMDGEAFQGGSGTDVDLLIGSGQLIEGFESGLIGKKKGEEVTLDLTFPDPYSVNPDFSGKPVQFKVTIHKISAAAELTDAWVEKNTEYKTVDEYKEEIKKSLQQNADMNYMNILKSNLFQKLVETSEIKEYPEEAMAAQREAINEKLLSSYANPAGMTLEEYWESQNISTEEAQKMVDDMAQNTLQQYLVVQAVLDAEDVNLTLKDYEKELETFAVEYGFKDVEALETAYSDKEMVKENVLWNKVCSIMQETAVIKDVPVQE